MKSLRQSLVDYELVQLKAIADCRVIPLNTSKQSEAVTLLTDSLLAPAAVAIALADLSGPEREALQLLVQNGGQIDEPRFRRHYGQIRPMGPARLEREQPWRNPANPAEGLWYRGFIFKAFQVTEQGSLEMVYIPTDLLPLLNISVIPEPDPNLAAQPEIKLLLVPMRPPEVVKSGTGRLVENIFNLLVYLQTTPVRVQAEFQVMAKDQAALQRCLLPPLWTGIDLQAELGFLLHLGRRIGLWVIKHGRLRPDREPARDWLQAGRDRSLAQLQFTWRADPTWNDLWHVPGLVPQPTGWENSPLLARSKILDYLAQVESSPEAWFALDDFVLAIKQIDPDFQRPDGDYESWYLQDAAGNSLMGFANWDKVEGALIRYLVTHILPFLEVVDLGLLDDGSAPDRFRITPAGAAFLANHSPAAVPSRKPIFLHADANFYVYVPVQASLYDRFQLARFAELDRQESTRAVYRISQASVGRALHNGVTADQIVAFMSRATHNQTPLKVVETLRTWGARRATVQIEQATLLRLQDDRLAAELTQHPVLGPLLGEVVGPKTILVPPDRVAEVRRLLMELGYLAF